MYLSTTEIGNIISLLFPFSTKGVFCLKNHKFYTVAPVLTLHTLTTMKIPP